MEKMEQIQQIIEQGRLAIKSLERVHNELAGSTSLEIHPHDQHQVSDQDGISKAKKVKSANVLSNELKQYPKVSKISEKLATIFREEILKTGLNYQTIGLKADVAPASISNIITGNHPVSVGKIIKLANYLGINEIESKLIKHFTGEDFSLAKDRKFNSKRVDPIFMKILNYIETYEDEKGNGVALSRLATRFVKSFHSYQYTKDFIFKMAEAGVLSITEEPSPTSDAYTLYMVSILENPKEKLEVEKVQPEPSFTESSEDDYLKEGTPERVILDSLLNNGTTNHKQLGDRLKRKINRADISEAADFLEKKKWIKISYKQRQKIFSLAKIKLTDESWNADLLKLVYGKVQALGSISLQTMRHELRKTASKEMISKAIQNLIREKLLVQDKRGTASFWKINEEKKPNFGDSSLNTVPEENLSERFMIFSLNNTPITLSENVRKELKEAFVKQKNPDFDLDIPADSFIAADGYTRASRSAKQIRELDLIKVSSFLDGKLRLKISDIRLICKYVKRMDLLGKMATSDIIEMMY